MLRSTLNNGTEINKSGIDGEPGADRSPYSAPEMISFGSLEVVQNRHAGDNNDYNRWYCYNC